MRTITVLAGLLVGCSSIGSDATPGGSSGGAGDETGVTSGSPSGGSSVTDAGESSPPGTSGGDSSISGGDSTGSDPGGASTTAASSDGATDSATDTADDGESTGTPRPAGGCGKDPGFRGAMDRTIMAAGMERSYILALPADYDPGKPYPLVFAWHGRGGSGALARLYYKIEEASQGQAIFLYPDGLPLADMANQTGWDLDPNNEDFALFDALLAEANGNLCVDQARVFSTGHSFGGYMSNQIGCFRSDVVRAIGLVAGGGPFGGCSGQVAAWLAHGSLDEIVPFAEGEKSRDHWAETNGCEAQTEPVDPAPCAAFTGCDAGFPVTWCAHEEPALDGHGWPAWAAEGIWGFFAGF